jgi:hypothetical protein
MTAGVSSGKIYVIFTLTAPAIYLDDTWDVNKRTYLQIILRIL